MSKTKKMLLISASLLSVALMITIGSLAIFTAKDSSNFFAQAGTVVVNLKDLNVTNSENINPGDNDPSIPENSINGTPHVFTYNVLNLGNKSIRTRQTIILTANQKISTDKESTEQSAIEYKTLDARFLALFIDDVEIIGKVYILSNNTETTSLESIDKTLTVKAVKYIFLSDIFDGIGQASEKENLKDVVKINETGTIEKKYAYDLSLLKEAGNEYQACTINIDVIIEAMQYRNTNPNDWSLVSTINKTYTTANVNLKNVPSVNQNKTGTTVTTPATQIIKND